MTRLSLSHGLARPVMGLWLMLSLILLPFPATADPSPAAQENIGEAELHEAISQLGNLDYAVRTAASRTLRRATPSEVVPALLDAARGHEDGYVRFRALVLLSGFPDPRVEATMMQLMDDRNDRLRDVVYRYLEHHPNGAIVPRLIAVLDREESEFVRPSLVRALAAHGEDPMVQQVMLREVHRGQDFFRSAVIEALGDYRAGYALAPLMEIAERDGPLQNDAAIALGKIGDPRALEMLARLQRTAPRSVQPRVAAAICMLGVNCDTHRRFITDTLQFAARNPGYQDLVRAAAAALGALAVSGDEDALIVLMEEGIAANDPVRAPIALAIGMVALRNIPATLAVLQKHPERERGIDLIGEAFDRLDEDFEEEQFFATVRRTYWAADERSDERAVAERLILKLEF